MTRSFLLLPLLALGACSASYEAAPPSPAAQQQLAAFIGGRTAGPPTRCIQAVPGMEIRAIGAHVVARSGGRRWINLVNGNCSEADGIGAYLITDSQPAGQYCANDSWRVASSSGGMLVGSCSLGSWTPYQ